MDQDEEALEHPKEANRARIAAAWAVHAFTATGVIAALLAIAALIAGDLRMTLIWLGVSLLIDGFDGPMARKVRVTEFAPRFDGAILDHVIDYLTYAVIPALIVYRFALVPPGWEIPAAAWMMTSALYCFGNREMKTWDNYFSGFPATWNLVVLCFWLAATGPWANLVAIGLLGLLTFVPAKFIHPFRVVMLRPLTLAVTAVWATLTLWLVAETPAGMAPADAFPWAFRLWTAASLYFLGICAWRTASPLWSRRNN